MDEREKLNIELEITNGKAPFFAFEGVGGSGKSHIIKSLELEMAQAGFITANYKISGMGAGERNETLRRIKEHQTDLISTGRASEKQIQDVQKDRIFMLGMKYQMRKMVTEIRDRSDLQLILLDRTPLMPWVYSISTNANNPFLNDILGKGIEYSRQLHIDTQYLFDVSPETAYARMIARMCTNTPDAKEVIAKVCKQINAPSDSSEIIRNKTLQLLAENHNIIPKSAENYCFISFETLASERKYFLQAGNIISKECGTRLMVINAELHPEEITYTISRDIESRIAQKI
jgi:thymidylate kinase